jgi:hypothetical protein
VQAELQRKYELLAQLEEKYGNDTRPEESSEAIMSTHAAIAEQSMGNLTVDVLEARALNACRMRSRGMQMQGMRTSVKVLVHGLHSQTASSSTAWRAGTDPEWNDKVIFEGRSREDTLLFQVRVHSFFLLSCLTTQKNSMGWDILLACTRGSRCLCATCAARQQA